MLNYFTEDRNSEDSYMVLADSISTHVRVFIYLLEELCEGGILPEVETQLSGEYGGSGQSFHFTWILGCRKGLYSYSNKLGCSRGILC